jgi:hypothetical protein
MKRAPHKEARNSNSYEARAFGRSGEGAMKLAKFRKGQMAVVMTLVIAALLGVMALGTDVGVMYYNYMQLQKAADAAALAGATYFLPQNATQTLPTPTIAGGCSYASQQQNIACTYALNNFAQQTDLSQGGIYVPAQSPPANIPVGAQTIQVTLKRTNIPVFFLRALGRSNSYAAVASSTAVQPTPVSSVHNGLFPVGMSPQPGGASMVYGQVYNLTGDDSPGNWGFLDIPQGCSGAGCLSHGGGAPLLASNISNGCTCSVSVGDALYPKSGISWGQVNSAMASIVTNSGATIPSTLTGNESQLVLIPIVDWSGTSGSSSGVPILGFAEMWIVNYGKSGSNVTISAQFVKYISKYASGGGGPSDYGAYQPPYLVQ